jgi:hypothetical protein
MCPILTEAYPKETDVLQLRNHPNPTPGLYLCKERRWTTLQTCIIFNAIELNMMFMQGFNQICAGLHLLLDIEAGLMTLVA